MVGIDESHTHDSTALIEIMKAAAGKRSDPLDVSIRRQP